jgi:hypothetical protein
MSDNEDAMRKDFEAWVMQNPEARFACYTSRDESMESSWHDCFDDGRPNLARDASGFYWGRTVQLLWDGFQAGAAWQAGQWRLAAPEPDFTNTARTALLWVLWHHQGANSGVGQAIRFALGMGQHDRMTDEQLAQAKCYEGMRIRALEKEPRTND